MNGDDRPDPDRLLAAARAAEEPPRGRLKIWLGAAAGVGKTCAMLAAAHEARAAGRDVVVGLVEHHGRADTLRRLQGLPVVALRRGPAGHPDELDPDAILARRPEVVIVDELAHTNAPGSRHEKRWQDVRELVDAGLEVWTAVNVQHLERTADVVARLTGVIVKETVPDAVVDEADEIEVVDLPPDALLERLRDGKVYGPDATRRALLGFFRRGNLLALRELALRRAAERVGEQVDDFRDDVAMPAVWSATDRLLVAVGPSPLSARLVRVAARLARALDAPWHAVLVRTPELGEDAARRAHEHLQLAESLGAQIATVASDEVGAALVHYARTHNLHTIVLGSSPRRFWQRSLADAVARLADDLELHVVPASEPAPPPAARSGYGPGPSARDLLLAAGFVALATGVGWVLRDVLPETDLLMLYLAAVVVASFRLPRAASLATALLAVAAFNFFFTHPVFTFRFSERRYLLTFAGLGALGIVVSTLAARARERAAVAARRETEARALFALGRALADAADGVAIAAVGAAHVQEVLQAPAVVWRVDADGAWAAPAPPDPADEATARWVLAHGRPAGPGTDTLASSPWLLLPLGSGDARHGVLAVRAASAGLDDPDRRHLLETMVDQVGNALAREALAARTAEAVRRADAERTRSSLLSSVSHDLRTPLAAITGAATTLQSEGDRVAPDARRRLLQQIVDEGWRLERLVGNLLQMSRLDEARPTTLDWEVAQEILGSALARVRTEVGAREVRVETPEDPLLVRCDALLVEQALVNFVENALRHTGGEIAASVREEGGALVFRVEDRGPGVAPADAERIFERFVRGGTPAVPGSGLGLAIVRAVARAHGGTADVVARDAGGAAFRVVLPRGGPDGEPLPEPTSDPEVP